MHIKTIAETAWHHDGDFEFFKNLITTLSTSSNADYIKFHITLDADEYIDKTHPGYDWVKGAMFSETQWDEILSIALKNDKKLMLLFNDKKAIDFGMSYKPELVEIHSVCLNDTFLLNHLKSNINQDTKIVLGIGGSSLYEVENAITILSTDNIVLMHGFQNYPTNYEDVNLSKMRRITHMFPQLEHGYADHTAWDNENNILITLLGASLGMSYVEKHVTTDTGKGRTDWQAAISLNAFNDLLEKLKILELANGTGLLALNHGEKSYSTYGIMKKAPVLKKDVKEGDLFSYDVFDFKRTGTNTDLSQLDVVDSIKKEFAANLPSGHCLTKKDFK